MAKYATVDLVGKDVHVTSPTVVYKIAGEPGTLANGVNNIQRTLQAGDYAGKIKTFISRNGKQYLIFTETAEIKTKKGVLRPNVAIEYTNNIDEGKLKEQGLKTAEEQQKINEEAGKGVLERAEDTAASGVKTVFVVGLVGLAAYEILLHAPDIIKKYKK